jgi:enoyl-CoA hydratase/carnithine racemase
VSTAARTTAVLPLAEAIDRLRHPDASEAFSPLTGEPLLAVDLGFEGGGISSEALALAREALVRLPAPSVALRPDSIPRAAESLMGRFDLVVEDAEQLELVRSRVLRNPLACMALVQLLRHSESLDVEGGLFAESLVYSTLQGGPEFSNWYASYRAKPPPPPTLAPAVVVRRERDRLCLHLNRPEKRNAFSSEMRDALCEALQIVLCDDSIREVTLTGEGPCFCSGGDLDEFGSYPDPATAHGVRSTRSPARLLAACADRLRSQVHGACIGAGIELPAFGARLLAAEDAFFQLPEVEMGLVPGAGGTVSLPLRIGRQRTAWMALSGLPVDAPTALAWGLVDELRRADPEPGSDA